uniref:Uncharacterized protein n=1 Tax=Pristionchus pacificus TaxID=54126 RepID=A0A2A6CY87_PRIPA|eukprot:PDM82993.1 hypothetical protein PRIPAC_37386 [Pristionchus pacificus]
MWKMTLDLSLTSTDHLQECMKQANETKNGYAPLFRSGFFGRQSKASVAWRTHELGGFGVDLKYKTIINQSTNAIYLVTHNTLLSLTKNGV